MTYVVTWVAPFQNTAGGGAGPYSGNAVPPQIAAVPANDPPHPGRIGQFQAAIVAAVSQPDPWQYGCGSGVAPYVGRYVPPQLAAVPANNPPFVRVHQTPINVGWQPPDPIQQSQARVLPAAPSFLSSISSTIHAVLLAWQIAVPAPVLAQPLNPAILSVRVDSPPAPRSPASLDAILTAWRIPDPQPILPRFVPQVPAAAPFIPSQAPWLGSVLTSWTPPDPTQVIRQQFPQSPAAISPFIPSPPTWLAGVVSAWNPASSTIVSAGYVIQSGPPPADNPPMGLPPPQASLPYILAAWWPADVPAISARGPNPGLLAVQVNNPPLGLNAKISNIAAVVAAGQSDPSAYTFLSGHAPFVAGMLPPSLLGVQVDNPPHTLFQSPVSDWFLPPDGVQQANVRSAIPQPPASIPSLAPWLPGVLAQWIPSEPAPILPLKFVPQGQPAAFLPRPPASLLAILAAWPPEAPQLIVGRNPSPTILAAIVSQPPPARPALDATLVAWRAADPQPVSPPRLNPALLAIRVDNPQSLSQSAINTAILATWQPTDSFPQFRAALPQGSAPSSFLASSNSAFPAVLAAWGATAPQPILSAAISPSILSVPVNNPPVGGREQNTILLAWRVTDAPVQQAARPVPQTGIIAGSAPLLPLWLPGLLSAWQQADQVPQIARFVPQGAPPTFIPASPAWIPSVLSAWVPAPSQPIVGSGPSPALLAIVPGLPPRLPAFQAILAAWQQVDPPLALRRPFDPSFAVPVNNPPFARLPGVLQSILSTWAPADPSPIIGGHPNPSVLAVRVDKPPPGIQSGAPIALCWIPDLWYAPRPISPATLGSAILLSVDPEYLLQYPDTVTTIQYP
jgi:hypothetical protein